MHTAHRRSLCGGTYSSILLNNICHFAGQFWLTCQALVNGFISIEDKCCKQVCIFRKLQHLIYGTIDQIVIRDHNYSNTNAGPRGTSLKMYFKIEVSTTTLCLLSISHISTHDYTIPYAFSMYIKALGWILYSLQYGAGCWSDHAVWAGLRARFLRGGAGRAAGRVI